VLKVNATFFNNSHGQWWSLVIVPLGYANIVQAVCNGDAELMATTFKSDAIGVPDNFFRWVRKRKDRWCEYGVGEKPNKLTKKHPDYKYVNGNRECARLMHMKKNAYKEKT